MFLLGAVYVGFVFALQYAFTSGSSRSADRGGDRGVQFFFSDRDRARLDGREGRSQSRNARSACDDRRLAAQANLPKPHRRHHPATCPMPSPRAQQERRCRRGDDRRHAELPPQELKAVLAHELTHIINRDMLVMTVATFFSMVISLIVQNMFWIGAFGGGGYGGGRRGGNNDNGGGVIIAILASVIAYVASFILIRTLSRYRELAADRGAALITGAPQNLASALVRIDGIIHGQGGVSIPKKDFRQAEAVNALFIVPALKGDEVASLFSTHPSTEERVARLNEMQRQMEQAHYNG
jgi:heat shock protein HtpX